MNKLVSLAFFACACLLANPASALVLCVKRGEFFGSVIEGSQVVIRTACLEDETTLQPYAIQPNGNLSETVTKSLITQIGENHSSTIGGSRSSAVAGSESRNIALDQTTVAGRDSKVQLGRNKEVVIGNNSDLTIAGDSAIQVGGEIVSESGGRTVVRAGQRVLLESGGDMILRAGRSSIILRQNGVMTLSGRRINMNVRRDVFVKGNKIRTN